MDEWRGVWLYTRLELDGWVEAGWMIDGCPWDDITASPTGVIQLAADGPLLG